MVKRGAARRCKKKKVAPLPTDEGRAMSGRKRRHREEPCSICDHYHDVSGKASVSALAPWSAEPEKRAGDAREKKGRRAGSSQSMALTVSRCLLALFLSTFPSQPPFFCFSHQNTKTRRNSTRAASPARPAVTPWTPIPRMQQQRRLPRPRRRRQQELLWAAASAGTAAALTRPPRRQRRRPRPPRRPPPPPAPTPPRTRCPAPRRARERSTPASSSGRTTTPRGRTSCARCRSPTF